MSKEIYLMELEGPAYERGLEHGRQVPELVEKAVASWGDMSKADPDEIERLLRKLETNTTRVHPEALDEMRGIAEGSDVPYDDILKLNLCEALWNDTTGWCTNVSFLNGSVGPILGKNSDLWEGDDEFHIVQRIKPGEGYTVLRCAFAGYIGAACGINEAGLAYGGSSVKVKPGSGHPDGVAVEVIVDKLLQHCATVQEGIQMAASMRCASQGANLTLVDSEGHGAVIEKAPSAQTLRWPADNVTFHTNHFVALSAPEELQEGDWRPNSLKRFANLEGLTQSVERTPEGMMQILRDHAEEGQICQHGDAELYTMVSHILMPRERRILVAEGYPCQNEYHEFKL